MFGERGKSATFATANEGSRSLGSGSDREARCSGGKNPAKNLVERKTCGNFARLSLREKSGDGFRAERGGTGTGDRVPRERGRSLTYLR